MPINWPWNCREETATLGTVAALPAGGGYGLIAPNGDGYWTAETYRFDPGTIVINQGDIVTLEIIGINGQAHPFAVEGYDVSGVVRRGHARDLYSRQGRHVPILLRRPSAPEARGAGRPGTSVVLVLVQTSVVVPLPPRR